MPDQLERAIGEVIIERLSALAVRGYTPQWSKDTTMIELIHPAAPHVTLWSDGDLMSRPTDETAGFDQRLIIDVADAEAFAKFLRTIPKPDLSHRFSQVTLKDLYHGCQNAITVAAWCYGFWAVGHWVAASVSSWWGSR